MIKVLEFIHKSEIKPSGGPNGYLYNLFQSFNSNEVQLCCLSDPENYGKKQRLKRWIPKKLFDFLNFFRQQRKHRQGYSGDLPIPNLYQYDAIHFHSTYDLYSHKEALKTFKGKIFLTTHSPCPAFYEMKHDTYTWVQKLFGANSTIRDQEKMDEAAFYLADYLVFPCPDAQEPYFKLWPRYAKIHQDCLSKYRYIISGSLEKHPNIGAQTIRSDLGLLDSFVVSFVGRHCYSKGYDILKRIGTLFLSRNPDSWFLVCGKESPLRGPKHPHWIEMGWSNNSSSYINASDVFLLPNRNTYFDLVLLEAMSLGKIIVSSKTGGNLYFQQFKSSGIFLFSSDEEAISILENIKHMKKEERQRLSQENRELFLKYFEASIFAKAYETLIKANVQKDNNK